MSNVCPQTKSGSRGNATRTNSPHSSLTSLGSAPSNSRIVRRIRGHPRPRLSMNPATTIACAIDSLRERGRLPARNALHFHVIGKGPGTGHFDSVDEDLEQHRGARDRVLPMDDGIDERLAQCSLRNQWNVFATDTSINLSSSQAPAPCQGAVDLVFQSSPGVSRADDIRCPVVARAGRTLDMEARCLRMTLRISSKCHHAVQHGTQHSIRCHEEPGVLHAHFERGLRVVSSLEPPGTHA